MLKGFINTVKKVRSVYLYMELDKFSARLCYFTAFFYLIYAGLLTSKGGYTISALHIKQR